MPVITPNIPEGLIEIMKTFAKCVLKEKPENIYEFSVVHFEKLLQERDGDLNKGYERFEISEKYIEAREKCLMSQIISHLNKKRIPDPVKIPPCDGAEDISLSETLSPKSLQHKLRPRKLSSRKASENLLSIKEEDEGHNPVEELALQHAKLTAAKKIQRVYKSYRKRKEERENGAALVIQRTLKKLFKTKLKGVKVLHNDGESTCSNIQNDSGVESDVPKDETEAEQENHKELNVGTEKYMDSDLENNSIITQQVPSFTEGERRSHNVEADNVEQLYDKADTVGKKEKSVDGESSVHKGSKIESSSCKQLDFDETQFDRESQCTEDTAEVDDENLKLDCNHTTDEVVKAEILKDVEEPLKSGAAEAGKSILEKEGRFVSNDTNNIGSAELVSDVQYKKSDDTENKGHGFPEAILEDVAKNGSKNDIAKETIEFVKSPRENEDGKQNSVGIINNDQNDKIAIENEFNNGENDNGDKEKKHEENEASSQNRNDKEENQSSLSLTENEEDSQGNKNTQIESTVNGKVKSEDVQKINNDKQIDINATKTGNEENEDQDSNLSLKNDTDSIAPKSVWYVGSEPIITSKSSEENTDSNNLENISTISNQKSEPEQIEQENNSTINENSKTGALNENIGSNNINQEYHNINTENETPKEKCEVENIETCNNANKNEGNEMSSTKVENDKSFVEEGTSGIKNEDVIKKHTEVDEAEKLENNEEKAGDTSKLQNEATGESDEGEKGTIISEAAQRGVGSFKNEVEKGGILLEKKTSESNEKNIKEGVQEMEENIGQDKDIVDEDRIGMQHDEMSISKQVEVDEENRTISETERYTENLKNKDAFEIQNEEISDRKIIESSEGEKDKNLKETNEGSIENVKNNEDKEEEKGSTISSDSNSVAKRDTSAHNTEINSSRVDDGDKSNDIPKITESSSDILKRDEETEETQNKKSPEELKESHIAQDKPKNVEKAENEVETEKYACETKDGIVNEENIYNNTVLNEKNVLLDEKKTEGEVDSPNEGSNVLSREYEDSIESTKAEVIEEEIKKVVAPSRFASPGRIIGKENNPVEKYKDLEAPEDKIIAKELLQYASVKDLDLVLKEEQIKSDDKTAELETKIIDFNSKDLIANHLEDDTTSGSQSPESNTSKENNKLDEDKDLKGENDEAEIKKFESLNSESQKKEPNEERLNVTNENINGIAEKNLSDEILESTQMGKNENPGLDLEGANEQKNKEERAFQGFIVEPAFKDNDGGNTGINPEGNVEKDSIKTNDADSITEKQEDRLNTAESQGVEVSKDVTQNHTNSEDKKEFVKGSQENEKDESCDDKGLNINLSKEDIKTEGKKENNSFFTPAEKQKESENVVGSLGENNTINNSANAAASVLINKANSIKQEKQEDMDEGQMALQQCPETIVRGQSVQNGNDESESDLKISHDDKNKSIHPEENEAGSPNPDNELNNKHNQNDEDYILQQIEEKEENHPPEEKIDDAESRRKEVNVANELTTDHQLARNGKEEVNMSEKENEGSLQENGEYNFKNRNEIVKPSNIDDQQKIVERTELGKPIENIELEKLNPNQKSENFRALNENTEDKEESDEDDTEFSQDTVEETQPSELIKSISKENPNQNVDVDVGTKNSEMETETTQSLENPSGETEIIEKPLTTIDVGVENSKKNSEEFNKDIVDTVKKDEEKGEDKEITLKDKQDDRKYSVDLSHLDVKNCLSGTVSSSGVESIENLEIQSNPEETTIEENHNKEQSQSKTTNQESIIDEIGPVSTEPTEALISEPRIVVDDETNKQKIMATTKSTEQAIILEEEHNAKGKNIYTNEKLNNLYSSDQENQNLEQNPIFSENAVKDVVKQEDTKINETVEDKNANNKENDVNSKTEKDNEDSNATNNEKEQADNSTELNKTYTKSKNNPDETPDYNEENHILKRQVSSSSSLLNALSNETSAANELLFQKSIEKPQGEDMVEVQEEPIVKQIVSQTETSNVLSADLSDIEINKKQQNSATLNRQSNDINEHFAEKYVNKEIKAEINQELAAKQLATTSEIHSESSSDAETSRVESRSTINDELSEIENIDISTYGEDSLEAMYYSLRKNEIMLDRMQKRASERKSASKERGPVEKLDLRQVKSMSEMGRSLSLNSDDEVVIKTLERGRDNDNDIQQFNNPISVVAQNTARLLESLHQMNSNPARPSSSSFEEERVVRQPCRMYSPSIRMKSRIPTPIKDFPKSVSFETPLAAVQRKSQKFMQLLHNDTQSSETLDSLLDQKETSDTIRQKMLAYSVSEADSDYCAEAEKKMSVRHDDSIVSTALETASTDTDSTIVSAATKIQAGARGFLTRRRLRRASDGALPQASERKASFGNEAIGESLEDLVEQNAASKIQKSYRTYLGNKQHKSESSKPSPETSSSSKSSDGSKPVGITQVKIGQKRDRDETDDAKKADDIDDGYHGAYFEGLNLAERRLTLQRGDAVQKYSTPEEESGFSLTNVRQVSDAGDSKPTTSPKQRKPVKNDTWRNFGMRQRTMPVQIESDILRVVPKHMRKRIKSAEAYKKSRQAMQ